MKILWLLLFPLSLFGQKSSDLNDFKKIEPISIKYKFPIEIDSLLLTSPDSPPYQYAGTLFSFIGLEHEAFDNFYGRYGARKPIEDSIFYEFESSFLKVNAKDFIINRAKNEQIVIINEAHHKGKHRVFTNSLLQELYNLGYRHLGLEALALYPAYTDTLLNERKYPTSTSGFYCIEPNFGNLIRAALKIGFNVFPYEGEGNGKEREINQAKNIQNYLAQYPNEKVLIHCGYAHATEGELAHSWEKAMAGRLYEYTGINPFTINQTKFDNRWDSSYLDPLLQRITIEEPSIYIGLDSVPYLGEVSDEGFDAYVFHEQTTLENNRPKWRQKPNDNLVRVILDSIPFENPYLLIAFKKMEDYNIAIPEDIIYVEPLNNQKEVYLILEDETYNIIAQDGRGNTILFDLKIEN